MLRLTVTSRNPADVVLAIDGWIAGQDVELLEQELESLGPETGRLVLDLEGVQSIDQDGITLLKRWLEKGVLLQGGPPFVRALLAVHKLIQSDQAEKFILHRKLS